MKAVQATLTGLVAEERPHKGIEQLLVQIVGKHGLGHVSDVKDLVDFSLLPSVADSEAPPTQLQLAAGLQSHALLLYRGCTHPNKLKQYLSKSPSPPPPMTIQGSELGSKRGWAFSTA